MAHTKTYYGEQMILLKLCCINTTYVKQSVQIQCDIPTSWDSSLAVYCHTKMNIETDIQDAVTGNKEHSNKGFGK